VADFFVFEVVDCNSFVVEGMMVVVVVAVVVAVVVVVA
jgi:hypothetical protein